MFYAINDTKDRMIMYMFMFMFILTLITAREHMSSERSGRELRLFQAATPRSRNQSVIQDTHMYL
jgi:CDR ABC transporter